MEEYQTKLDLCHYLDLIFKKKTIKLNEMNN